MASLRAAFYGDDFTGSVDSLLQFARRGWSGRLFVGLPPAGALADAAADHDVVGIAGIARSLATAELDAEVRPALEALVALGPQVVQYKACSTADSSPTIGSIGRVIELGREVVSPPLESPLLESPRPVPVLFAQPDFGRYTVFGHHFAAEDGVIYRLDRQPTMSTHPSTPMTESDLAVHLSRQTPLLIRGIPFTSYGDATDLAERLRTTDAAAVVLDALTDDDLAVVGAAVLTLEAPAFVIGSGGLSHGIAAADPRPSVVPSTGALGGPVLAVSGSRSAQTRRQIDAAAEAGWLVADLALDPAARAAAMEPVLAALGEGRSVALRSDAIAPAAASDRPLLEQIADAAAAVIAAALASGATRRILVCGGDTSSRVVRLLGVESLSIAANPWHNIVLLTAHSADPAIDGAQLQLKGGQVGEIDLFERIRELGG